MATGILEALHEHIEDEIEGLVLTPEGLSATSDTRWGEVTLRVDHDEEAGCVRVSAAIPAPPGAGPELLIFCLSLNAQYFDVKIALDDEGRLLVHGDLEVEDADAAELAPSVVDAAESILDVIDDDLVEWCSSHGLGTPAQRKRWESQVTTLDG